MAKKRKERGETKKAKRSYISQTDIPRSTLAESLRLAESLKDDFAAKSAAPHQLAMALDLSPRAHTFGYLCGASMAYGLTEGGYNAKSIALTALGRKIVAPTEEGEDRGARVQAVLKPRILRDFFERYDHAKFPSDKIAQNVIDEMGVPRERTANVLNIIKRNGEFVGIIHETKTGPFVAIEEPAATPKEAEAGAQEIAEEEAREEGEEITEGPPLAREAPVAAEANRRVYVTHGRNRAFIEPIKKLLAFGEMEAVVSVERESVSKPVPDKVLDDMRTCGAAIIHIDAEETLIDGDAKEHKTINPNVLIEIGAAMALYARRFILLVREGLTLPSNLQGLYEVRYQGDALDGDATIRLLEAVNDIKNHPLPERHRTSESQSQ